MRISDWSSDVCSSDLVLEGEWRAFEEQAKRRAQVDMDIAVRWRTILPYATQLCVSAVDRLMAASGGGAILNTRSEEHTSELQSLMRISYAVFCLKKKTSNK